MNNEIPRVSVILAVRDGETWAGQAIASVLSQTLRDLELVVIDDGSVDDTPRVVADAQQRDSRVVLSRIGASGLAPALNHAIGLARAPLLARLDADDLAHSERLARQVAYLSAHPHVGLLGSASYEWRESGAWSVWSGGYSLVRPPTDDATLRRLLIRRNPFAHSSVMFRASLVRQLGGYDESFPVAQDYDLWLRMSRVTAMANLDLPLVTRRLHTGSVSARRDSARLWAEARARLRAVRAGTYPAWCAVYALRPLVALALPRRVREAVRVGMAHTQPLCNLASKRTYSRRVREVSVFGGRR